MFNFLGRIVSGIGYGIGIGIGVTIWDLFKKLIRYACVGGGIAVLAHQIGIYPEYPGGFGEVGQQFAGLGGAVMDWFRALRGQ